MPTQFINYLTIENIYLWTNFSIIPFWLMLIIIPNSKFTQVLVNTVILPLILSSIYLYVLFQMVVTEMTILEVLKLYVSLDNLYALFATESFLTIFWLHFVSLNLFLGLWVARDGYKYNIPKSVVFFPLVLI